MKTNTKFSPHDLLPMEEPRLNSPPDTFFYDNVAKHLIKDTVRIMANGLHIDLEKVKELEETLDTQLERVQEELDANPTMIRFQEKQCENLTKAYVADRKTKLKDPETFRKPFKYDDMVHRSYFMDTWADKQGITKPSETLPTGVSKWPVNLCKKIDRPIIKRLLAGSLADTNPIVIRAMDRFSQDKADIYNKKYLDQIRAPTIECPSFNPGSSKQKQELFEWLGISSEKTSKTTGLPSFDRSEVERINKETTDDDIKHITQCFIDHSFAAIVRNNFIEAFYNYTIQDRLYGSYKLFGAKSFRFTSNSPNMLNMPSTGSVFAKPIKQCFTAPEGTVIMAADFNALEDRVIASLTRDANKTKLQTNADLDGHLFHAAMYFKEDFERILGPMEHEDLVKAAMASDSKEIKELRQKSKGVTFGCSYGAFPPKIAQSLKCSIEEAQSIFNAYHNDLYPDITDYRENYVLPTAYQNGRLHLGMGCYIYSDDPKRDIRTLANASVQFWSILTILAINKMHQLIDEAGYQDDVLIVSTIYDSAYFQVTEDPDIIKWVNDTFLELMEQDFMFGQTVPNESEFDIGYDWATMKTLPKDVTINEIQGALDDLNTP